jgi:hypothetical protein
MYVPLTLEIENGMTIIINTIKNLIQEQRKMLYLPSDALRAIWRRVFQSSVSPIFAVKPPKLSTKEQC